MDSFGTSGHLLALLKVWAFGALFRCTKSVWVSPSPPFALLFLHDMRRERSFNLFEKRTRRAALTIST